MKEFLNNEVRGVLSLTTYGWAAVVRRVFLIFAALGGIKNHQLAFDVLGCRGSSSARGLQSDEWPSFRWNPVAEEYVWVQSSRHESSTPVMVESGPCIVSKVVEVYTTFWFERVRQASEKLSWRLPQRGYAKTYFLPD